MPILTPEATKAAQILHFVWVNIVRNLSRAESDWLTTKRLPGESSLETCLRLAGYTEVERASLAGLTFADWRAAFKKLPQH